LLSQSYCEPHVSALIRVRSSLYDAADSMLSNLLVRTSALSAAILAITLPLPAQSLPSQPRGANGPAAPTADLSGVWNGGGPIGDIADGLAPGETIPILPEAERILKARQSKDDPEANCLLWVPEILAPGFRKFWPVDLMPQATSGRQVRGVWFASTAHRA
jgi:hypothetical protein